MMKPRAVKAVVAHRASPAAPAEPSADLPASPDAAQAQQHWFLRQHPAPSHSFDLGTLLDAKPAGSESPSQSTLEVPLEAFRAAADSAAPWIGPSTPLSSAEGSMAPPLASLPSITSRAPSFSFLDLGGPLARRAPSHAQSPLGA